MPRGNLRIYLGVAPGVGKTYAMLNEGRRRKGRGGDIVVGYVETHGRPHTAAQLGDLEVIPRRGGEMDVDAVIARRPRVVLVDELAHDNGPTAVNRKRWQDVEQLLDEGIDVVTTLDVQQLESLGDVIEGITGRPEPETVPDAVAGGAQQIELVDMTPEALRRRLAHGNVYPAEQLGVALGNAFRPRNLAALRQLALLWVADHIDQTLGDDRSQDGADRRWETRERVVVALTAAPGGEHLIRRAARMAARGHGDLVGVHVRTGDGGRHHTDGGDATVLRRHRSLLAELGGRYVEVVGADVAEALVDVARAEHATQLVVGATKRSRVAELVHGSVIGAVLRQSESIDVHVISHQQRRHHAAGASRRNRARALPVRRQVAGLGLAVASATALTAVSVHLREHIGLSTSLMLFVLIVNTAAAVGGVWAGLVAAVGSSFLVNWFLTPPFHTWQIADGENLVALMVFLIVAASTSWFVSTASRRSAEAARARAEAETFMAVAATSIDDDPVTALLGRLCDSFGLDGAAILSPSPEGWQTVATAGEAPPSHPADPGQMIALGDNMLAVRAHQLTAEDRRLLGAFAAQLAAALRTRRLSAEAATAAELARGNELRTGLLRAVSHDLRSPLAAIKAAVTSLVADDVEWEPAQVREFHEAINSESDRLNRLIGNLLDMSRVTTGTVEALLRPVGLEEVVPAALASLGGRVAPGAVRVDVPETLPRVKADVALLERAVANLVDNAISWSPPNRAIAIEAGPVGDRVHLRIVDHGPGIPTVDRERVFLPFQRRGDQNRPGVGLGLAVAKGFVDTMQGELTVEDTPGGGLTIVVSLPVTASREPVRT